MTEPSEAAKAKAQELCDVFNRFDLEKRVAKFVQQVSDAAKAANLDDFARHYLDPFILPEPVDPLAEALRASVANPEQFAAKLRGNLAKQGYKIVKISEE